MFPKRTSGVPLLTLSTLNDVSVGFVSPLLLRQCIAICGRRMVVVARYRMICLVLVNSYFFPLLCGARSTVPLERFNLISVIIFASLILLDFSMLGYCHSLLGHCNIQRFWSSRMHIFIIPTCVHLPIGGHYLVPLTLTARYRVVLKEHLLVVDHFNKKITYLTFPLIYPYMSLDIPTRNVFARANFTFLLAVKGSVSQDN